MTKAALLGTDTAKAPEGYAMAQDVDYSDSQDTDFGPMVSIKEILAVLLTALDRRGYQTYSTPCGRFCGLEVYKKSKLEIFGLDQPKDFHFYRKIETQNATDRDAFLAVVREICEVERDQSASKKHARAWETLCLDFEDRLADGRSDTAVTIRGSLNDQSPRRATLTGRSGFHKAVPPLEWFPPALQEINPGDLLTLFPEAEKDQLMIILGRALTGPKGTRVAEGILEHTARAYAVIVGTEAGMGKSTLLGYIKGAMDKMGYIMEEINSDLNKFGWGPVATADLSTIDDLTDEIQRRLLKDNRVKSIVSSGPVKVESKGVDAVNVQATTVMLGCTNMTNYSHYIGMDSGSLSRLNQLDTYCTHELEAIWGTDRDYRIKPYWEELADRLGVTTDLIAARLLRGCLDRFLEVTGHTFASNGALLKDPLKDTLEATVKANREAFRIDVSLRHAEELTRVAIHLVALAIADSKDRDRPRLLENLPALDFGPDLLAILIELFVALPLPQKAYPGLGFHYLSLDCRKYLKAKIQDFRSLAGSRSVEAAFGVLVGELKSTKGFGYPKSSAHYQAHWLAEKRLIPTLVKRYGATLETEAPPEPIQSALGDIDKLLLNLAA